MTLSTRITLALATIACAAVPAAPVQAADPPEQPKSCVGQFVSTLAPQGVIDDIASTFAHNSRPFGETVISVQARGDRTDCPYKPEDFTP